MNLDDIYAPVKADLEKVEQSLESISEVDISLLSKLLHYVVSNGGKRIRPAFTLLSGKFSNYDLTKLIPMAAAVELLHTATLVHDDIVDESALRRGKQSVSQAWGEASALLLGDYLFARAGSLVASTGNLRAVRLFAQTLMTISSGELAQIDVIFDKKQGREYYYDWVSAKTASLFSMATESGAVLSDASEEIIIALKDYGHNFGIAFQVVDDVLDFIGQEAELGKPVGSDLIEGAVTLPAILFAESDPEGGLIKRIIENKEKGMVPIVVEKIRASSVIDECLDIAEDYCSQACQALDKLPKNSSLQTLLDLAAYIIKRRK
jgi:geranylgeranyl pyrophosphate synthase